MTQPVQHSLEPEALQCAAIDRSVRHPVMFLFTSGAAWLAVALVLGLVASVKLHAPEFLGGWAWLGFGRVRAAHLDALVYGWGCQAAFGVLVWLAARLSGRECRNPGALVVAGHLWNLGVAAGTAAVLGGYSTGLSWMEFPPFVWPVLLLSYAWLAAGSLAQFRGRVLRGGFPGQWHAVAALLWFPWVFATAHLFVHHLGIHPLLGAAVNAWFKSALVLLFFVPAGAAAAYYLAAKITGQPVSGGRLGPAGFWVLAVVGPWAGMEKLAGAPIPDFLPGLGAAATVAAAIPMLAIGVGVLATVAGRRQHLSPSPALRFTVAGTAGLLLLGIAGICLSLPGATLPRAQFSVAEYGREVFTLYGVFSMLMFGAIYFIVPRVTRREWLSRRLIRAHFWSSVYGSAAFVVLAVAGGLAHGAAQEDWRAPWQHAAAAVPPHAFAITFAWLLVAFANLSFLVHLAFMWLRLGRRGAHPTLLP